MILMFLVGEASAQIYGCTDPQANNYNPLAAINDGACLYNTTTMSPIQSIDLPAAVLETSGLFFYDGHYWTHNDDTEAMFFAIDSITAEITDTVFWDCLSNIDWEECHVNDSHLIIGDIGNNLGNRTDLKFFLIPLVDFYTNNIQVVDTIHFSYADQVSFNASLNSHDFDAEAFIAMSDSIFIFSKCWISHQTKRYAVPFIAGDHVAQLREVYDVQGLITGATFFHQNQSLALCGYTAFLQPFVWLLFDFDYGLYFNGNKRRIELGLPFHQIEANASRQGAKFYLTNEQYVGGLTVNQKWHEWDATSFFENPTYVAEVDDNLISYPYPIPTTGAFDIRMSGPRCVWRYELYDAQGVLVKKGIQLDCMMHFDISHLPDGTYYVHILQRETRMVHPVLKQSSH